MKLGSIFRLRKQFNIILFVTSVIVILIYIRSYSFYSDNFVPSSSENIIQILSRNLSMLADPSKARLDLILNVRKLNIFAVHEMNRLIQIHKNHRHLCSKWWSNPLNTISIQQVENSSIYTDHLISFQAEPGVVLFQVLIRQLNPPLVVWEEPELRIIGQFTRLDNTHIHNITKNSSLRSQYCKGVQLPDTIATICSCVESEALLSRLTDRERKTWNTTDVELLSWKPDQSFYVGDYINFTDFSSFVISPGKKLRVAPEEVFCGPNLKMLIMISSAPTHYEHRKVIRRTYGSDQNLHPKGVRLVFLLGKVQNKTVQNRLESEAEIHDDIIQADFMDSYHNLTLSHLSMYKWAYLICNKGSISLSTVPFILKADDDFFINIDLALRVAEENPDIEMMGCLYCGTKPVRSLAYMTKYYTPRYMHSAEWYAGYLSGVTYILRGDIIPRLLYASMNTPIIHMDDAYVTGLLPRLVNIYPHKSPLMTYGRPNLDPCSMKKMMNAYSQSRVDMQAQWEQWILPAPKNCTLSNLEIKIPPLRSIDKEYCFF